jgi:glucose-6-phosphate dehydrogenase assembly protein OpcA
LYRARVATSEELIRQMRAAGYRDEEIAGVELRADPPRAAQEVVPEPSLGDVLEKLDQVVLRLERVVSILYRRSV